MALKLLRSIWKTIKGDSSVKEEEKNVVSVPSSELDATWELISLEPDVPKKVTHYDYCVSNNVTVSQDFSVRNRENIPRTGHREHVYKDKSKEDVQVDEHSYHIYDWKPGENEYKDSLHAKQVGGYRYDNFPKDFRDAAERVFKLEQRYHSEKSYSVLENEYFNQANEYEDNFDASEVSANSDNNILKHFENIYGTDSSGYGFTDFCVGNYEEIDYSEGFKDYLISFGKEYSNEEYQYLYAYDGDHLSDERNSSDDEDPNYNDEYSTSKYNSREALAHIVFDREFQFKENNAVSSNDRNSTDGVQTDPFKVEGVKSDKISATLSPTLQCEHKFMENLLFEFYEHLHDYLRKKYSVSDESVKLAMKKLIFNYKNLDKCETPEPLDFNDIPTCLGYLHRYAICHSALVYHAVTKVLTASTLFLGVFSSEKLDMMCLGSGPGNDFVGFSFALMNARIKISNIDVTVVDMYSGWYTIFSETMDMFNSLTKNAYEKPSKTFIQADLSNYLTWNSVMKTRLKDADLVSLVKVLSNISRDAHAKTLANIVGLMKDGAFLIIIDCPLPVTELSTLEYFLHPVYVSAREKFNFKEKKTRFGYPNISQCTAYTRVYKKRNSVQCR